MGAAALSPPLRCDSGFHQPLRSSSLLRKDVSRKAPSAGGLPAHHKAQRGRNTTEVCGSCLSQNPLGHLQKRGGPNG